LREADVQQPNTAAHLSFTSSFFAFSAKFGQSLAPSSWITLICRPRMPPWALISEIASFSASTEPVSLIAIVPVMECRMPTVTVLSVTARPVVLTAEVGGASAHAGRGSSAAADAPAMPCIKRRRLIGLCDGLRVSSAMVIPQNRACRNRTGGKSSRMTGGHIR